MGYARCSGCGQKIMEDEETCGDCYQEMLDRASFDDDEGEIEEEEEEPSLEKSERELTEVITVMNNIQASKSSMEK